MQLGGSSHVQGRVTFPESPIYHLGLHNKLSRLHLTLLSLRHIHSRIGTFSSAEKYAENQWGASFSQTHKRRFDSSGFLGRSEG